MQASRSKKDAAITVHLPAEIRDEIVGIATELHGGMGASEYLFDVITAHLEELRTETKIKARIFGLTEN